MASKDKVETATDPKSADLQRLEGIVRSLAADLSGSGLPEVHVEAQTGDSRIAVRLSSGASAGEPALAAISLGDLKQGDRVPNRPEVEAVGPFSKRIVRNSPEFAKLVSNKNPKIVFKDEEKTGADRRMTPQLKAGLDALALLVAAEWPGVKLRVTEAWDENGEHSGNSLHYEGRAADLTTFPIAGAKLGRLARLAVQAGLGWVFFENSAHVHVSVTKEK